MPLSFKTCELPNPYLLTSPENLEYMKNKEREAEAALKLKNLNTKGKASGKPSTVSDPSSSLTLLDVGINIDLLQDARS